MDGLTTLANASTTQLSIAGNLWLNGNATTTSAGNIQGQGILTMLGTGTSTFSGGIQSTALNITSATASSTFANGIILSKGCFLMPDGTCAGAGGGSGTINSGTTGQFPYYAGSGTTLTATSSLFIHSNQNIGIGTTTPNWLLQAAGVRPFLTLSDTSAAANNKHWFLSSQGGNFYVGTSSDAYATSTVSKLTILSNGNVGIGTTTPQTQFAIQGDAYFAGNVGVGVASPSTALHVIGKLSLNDGNNNVYVGSGAGNSQVSGISNTAVGIDAGYSSTNNYNTFIGQSAGYNVSTGANNTYVGFAAGNGSGGTGSATNNVAIGYKAGFNNKNGSSNVFIGNVAGYDETGSNKLYIANSSTNPPLIYGNFSIGSVGIGTTTPTTMFQVATSTANATTTLEFGKANQNKGSCLKMYDVAGTLQYVSIQAGSFAISATSCE